jgi:hypothetical protein
MIVTNYSYPHPVLGHTDDVEGEFGVDFEEELGRDEILLHCEIKLENKTLYKAFEEDKVNVVCDIDCPSTLYRSTIKIKDKSSIIKINSNDVRDKVDVNFYVIASEGIRGYQPEGINIDYENVNFDIEKGEVLAVDKRNGHSYFIAKKSYEQFKSASSFMQVVKQEDIERGPVDYVLDDERILIRLPEKDFNHYSEIYTDDSFPAVYHAILALPALTTALSEALSEGKEDLKEKLWYQHIFQIRENDPSLKNIPWERDYAIQLAQAILKLPIYRSFENIKEHINALDIQE